MEDYTIVQASSVRMLAERVRENQGKGWKVTGGLAITKESYIQEGPRHLAIPSERLVILQAMVKPDDDSSN